MKYFMGMLVTKRSNDDWKERRWLSAVVNLGNLMAH